MPNDQPAVSISMPYSVPDDVPQKPQRREGRPRWRRLRYFYIRFLRLQGSPQQLARGLAAGVFAGCYPLFGFQTLIGLAIATVVRGNRILAAAGTWVSNPFTYVPIYAFNFQLGHWLLGGGSIQSFDSLDSLKGWMSMGLDVSSRLMLGSTVVGAIAAVLSYYLGIQLTVRIRRRRLQRTAKDSGS